MIARPRCVPLTRWTGTLVAIGALLVPALCRVASAQDRAARQPETFATIVEEGTQQTLQAVADYLAKNPNANDFNEACKWTFRTAIDSGLEAYATTTAETYLSGPSADKDLRRLALRVKSLGLAKQGHLEKALAAFDEYLRSARLSMANETIDFAISLSSQAQLADESEQARAILAAVSQKYSLLEGVRQLCDNRLAKLELVGTPLKKLDAHDIHGDPISQKELAGKVVLIDFWATNCPPCLEELPNLKQIYSEFHERGFEIVGISFDKDPHVVEQFQVDRNLGWPLAMNQSADGELSSRFAVQTIPSAFLVDRSGKVAYVDLFGPDLQIAVERLVGSGE